MQQRLSIDETLVPANATVSVRFCRTCRYSILTKSSACESSLPPKYVVRIKCGSDRVGTCISGASPILRYIPFLKELEKKPKR